jgi:hypothetical protein
VREGGMTVRRLFFSCRFSEFCDPPSLNCLTPPPSHSRSLFLSRARSISRSRSLVFHDLSADSCWTSDSILSRSPLVAPYPVQRE